MNLKYVFVGLIFILSCDSGHEHYRTSKDFILISEVISYDKNFKIVEYQFDHGAFGYSRTFWAITPADNEKLNLGDYLLPDGYKAVSWTRENEAVVEKWEPYYYKDKQVDLKTGDLFKNVMIRVN